MPNPNRIRAVEVSSRNYYKRYKHAYNSDEKRIPSEEKWLAKLQSEKDERGDIDLHLDQQIAKTALALADARNHQRAEDIAEASGWDYKLNPDAYHDLAVIDAHIDGVVINVQQPLEIGQKIEVHTGNNQ